MFFVLARIIIDGMRNTIPIRPKITKSGEILIEALGFEAEGRTNIITHINIAENIVVPMTVITKKISATRSSVFIDESLEFSFIVMLHSVL